MHNGLAMLGAKRPMKILRGGEAKVIINGERVTMFSSATLTAREKNELKQKSTALQKRIAKFLSESRQIIDRLDADPGSAVKKQLNSRFDFIVRKIEKDNETLREVFKKQQLTEG